MPIYNLTPHGVSLYSASQIPTQPVFERAAGGWLLVGERDTRGGFAPLGYSRWPRPGEGLGNPIQRPARVAETRSEVTPLEYPSLDDYEGPGALPGNVIEVTRTAPVRTVTYGAITDLPAPEPGVYLIVSLPVVEAARREGRATSDLLTMGDLIRSPDGEIVGVTSFYRW